MLIQMIEGATRVIGKAQGYIGLPLKDAKVDCPVAGKDTPTMTTSWMPTPEELVVLNAGAPVYVTIYGTQHPPILVSTGPLPEGDIVLSDAQRTEIEKRLK